MFQQQERKEVLIDGLDLVKPGLEISPLFRPTLHKNESNVFYTDYCSAEESRRKHEAYEHDEIMDIDFEWTPGKNLAACVPKGLSFDWAISSHVIEHVPDPIGWLLEVFSVLKPKATFSIALPNKDYCFDKFRNETESSTLIDAWIRSLLIPSSFQLFDFLSKSFEIEDNGDKNAWEAVKSPEEAKRSYSDEEALDFALQSWVHGKYIDAHCSAFSPDGFVKTFQQINDLGILNMEISEPVIGHREFFVRLRKLGEPRISHPKTTVPFLLTKSEKAELVHLRKAYKEAIAVQNHLQQRGFIYLLKKILRPILRPLLRKRN